MFQAKKIECLRWYCHTGFGIDKIYLFNQYWLNTHYALGTFQIPYNIVINKMYIPVIKSEKESMSS